jgi:adenylate kinase family enzyme
VTVHKTVFAFFGVPGAGKSTLCRRFGEMHAIPWLDTDTCMTAEEVAAIEAGRYTQAMRLSNIARYTARVRDLLATHPAAAIADGLPNDEARAFLRASLADVQVVFILVKVPPELWEARLSDRVNSPVRIDVAAAEHYVRENWREPAPGIGHVVLENADEPATVDEALRAIWLRHVPAVRATTGREPPPARRARRRGREDA